MFRQGYHSPSSDRARGWTFAVHFPAKARKFSPHRNVQTVPGEHSASQSIDTKGSSSSYKAAKTWSWRHILTSTGTAAPPTNMSSWRTRGQVYFKFTFTCPVSFLVSNLILRLETSLVNHFQFLTCASLFFACFRKQLGKATSGRKEESWERVRSLGESFISNRSPGNADRRKDFFFCKLTFDSSSFYRGVSSLCLAVLIR